ncbi:hypothetical protein E1267_04405 [Nonomuraea longispora]|uniref:Sigma-70 family RNA polymerase sigma factor n=1 Tax=Nonomuraea longispora TaxID=1848320 RepID=A0A4R4NML8_9ACTN|nr:sigma factor [Nonomuraea longispora]TDC10445.1 hypothetical protein E1267_04405 [Nonomuraea longispora]
MTDVELEHHRVALTGYCYRMLGSGFEAEDAVQETFVRAWQTYDPARGTLRTWLFHLATNVCLDMLRGSQRRARAMDLGPAATPGDALGEPLPHGRWIQPVPDAKVLDPAGQADETVDESLLTRYVSAFERYDVAALVSLLHEDATSEMPPFAWWLRGREHIHTVLTAAAASGQAPCQGSRLLPVRANGSPAFGQYLYGEPFALVVLDVAGGRIAGEATFLDPGLFPFFGLPMSFAAPLRTR